MKRSLPFLAILLFLGLLASPPAALAQGEAPREVLLTQAVVAVCIEATGSIGSQGALSPTKFWC